MDSTSLKAWIPGGKKPWDQARAAHLLRRTGFAPTISEVRQALLDGPGKTIDKLIDTTIDSQRHDELDEIGRGIAARQDIEALRGWWLMRMRYTTRPLHARLALMWHNHFATSNAKIGSPPMMLTQLRSIEKYAAGQFFDLLLAMSKDPAMIVWLDGALNLKGRPNENYARELFELFSLGAGNYTEKDIQESARAFTGWSQKNSVYRFRQREHDEGEKIILGTRGNLNGTDVCSIASKHPACARFIASRLLHEFVTPAPEDQLVQNLADELAKSDMNIAESLRTLLKSEAFFHASAYRARIKSPIEYVLGMARSLDLDVPAQLLASVTVQMSQSVFEPPSVKGWDGHRAWINSTTMLVRLNAAQHAAEMVQKPEDFFATPLSADGTSDIRSFGDLLLDGRVPAPLVQRLKALDTSKAAQAHQAINLLLTSPEYQMA